MKKHKTEIHFSLLILTIIAMCMLISCSTTKKVNQQKTTSKTETTTNENSTSTVQTVATTKITEQADSVVVVPGSELSVAEKLDNLMNGDTMYFKDQGLSIITFYDSLAKTIKSQAKMDSTLIRFYINKVTEKQEATTGSVTTNKQETKKQSVQTETKDRQVERTSLPWWLIVIGIIVLLAGIAFAVLKIKKYI